MIMKKRFFLISDDIYPNEITKTVNVPNTPILGTLKNILGFGGPKKGR
jgi:hypothetical protein